MSVVLRTTIFCLGLPLPMASAETPPGINAFFGFEYVLTPLAIKWSCGGKSDQDMAALDAIISAYPDDAEEAELKNIVELLLEVSRRDEGITEILGFETTDRQQQQLCAAALPLGIAELSPKSLIAGADEEISAEQEAKWVAFYTVIEGWQTDASP